MNDIERAIPIISRVTGSLFSKGETLTPEESKKDLRGICPNCSRPYEKCHLQCRPQKTKLNLGCGNDIRNGVGWINVDAVNSDGVDIVHDLNESPYPWPDSSVDIAVMRHVLEHVDDVQRTLDELHRILKPDGRLYVEVPHFTSIHATTQHEHKTCFSYQTLNAFTDETLEAYTDRLWDIERNDIVFTRPLSRFLTPFVNLHKWTKHVYSLYLRFPREAVVRFEMTPVKT